MNSVVKTARLCLAVSLLSFLTGCGVIDYFFLPPPEDTALELFEAGNQAMSAKDYSEAIDLYTKLKDRYPFSPYTPQAELALGDAYFLDEEYPEAASTYKEFEELHPRHEQIPYVLYQIGVANYRRFSTIDLPQKNITEALEYFYRLREAYPNTKYAQESAEYIMKCRRLLADHEVFIADFYWNTGRYGPAWNRYEFVTENFQDLPEVYEYARHMSQLAYFEYQKQAANEAREERHGTWKHWFDWL